MAAAAQVLLLLRFGELGGGGTGDQVVGPAGDNLGLNELPRCERGWVAIGKVHERVDIRRLTLETTPQHQVVLGRGPVHEDPDLLADTRTMRALYDLFL